MEEIPESHPRYESLMQRHRIEAGVEQGLTSRQGLVAQGRGEAFDYLLGEQTIPSADTAERVAAAHLLDADHAVLSVNGNAAALVPEELVCLAETTGADLEVNLFNRTEQRVEAIADHLREHGASEIKGEAADERIPGLDHERAKVDADGYITVLGRVDDVVNVSGHRIGTMEVESAIVGVEGVAEAAVVGSDHPVKGEVIYAYTITEEGQAETESFREEIVESVEESIGSFARPAEVVFTPELPKTRSGKIMRRLLADIANDDTLGTTSTLRNPDVVTDIEQKVREEENR